MQDKHLSWEILYAGQDRATIRAVELCNREAGKHLIRKEGIYTLYVLPCHSEYEQRDAQDNSVFEAARQPRPNRFVIGTYRESEQVRRDVQETEIPRGGHLLRIKKNAQGGSTVIMTAHESAELYAAVSDFFDRYVYRHPTDHYGLRYPDLTFDSPLPQDTLSGAPKAQRRSVFTWGTPINDYRAYLDDMARMRLNQLILWNDFVPVNARDIIEYAHQCGIEVLFGYSWGWGTAGSRYLNEINEQVLTQIQDAAIRTYEEIYAPLGADGIYFQSFTEREDDTFGKILIAQAVTDLVNTTAAKLLERHPGLHIQFGLHATSVMNHLDIIAQVDTRVEILWEDYGTFPSGYFVSTSEEEYARLEATAKKILHLRPGAPLGMVFKGFMILDWLPERFVNQSGSFILGQNAPSVANHDQRIRAAAWRMLCAAWARYGDYARRFAEFVIRETDGKVNLCMAGTFDGGIRLPQQLCASFFYDPQVPFDSALQQALQQEYVRLD